MLRKKNKLPADVHSIDFQLEYGKATIEVHKDSTFLDGQYTVFGRIITQESFDTLDYIAELQTMPNDQAVQTRDAALITSTVKDRSEISNILDLNPPTRTGAEIMKTEPEPYSNNLLGISFNAPVGWLIQSPPKTEPSVPDLVVLGPQTDSSSPAISFSVTATSESLEKEIETLQLKLSPLIEQQVLVIKNEGKTGVWMLDDLSFVKNIV